MIRSIHATAAGLLVGTLAAHSAAETFTVIPGQSIQAAINQAEDGDVVHVQPGTYRELIDLKGKAITLKGSPADPSLTVLDGDGLGGSVITCDSGETRQTLIKGFEVKGGTGTLVDLTYFGGGMYIKGSSPTVWSCHFKDNQAHEGGGVCLRTSVSRFVECVFESNVADGLFGGGGGMLCKGASPYVLNCKFVDNAAPDDAGGGLQVSGGSPVLANVLFAHNSAEAGGGLHSGGGNIIITNATFTRNEAIYNGAAVTTSCGIDFRNCIFWENYGPYPLQIPGYTGSSIVHSIVQGGWSGEGGNNSSSDPFFLQPDQKDFRLSAESPGIDGGDASLLPIDAPDLDDDEIAFEPVPNAFGVRLFEQVNGGPGVVPVHGSQIDMGAFEYQACPWDLTGDGAIDVFDLLDLLGAWGDCPSSGSCPSDVTGDGVTNVFDLLDLLSQWGACPG